MDKDELNAKLGYDNKLLGVLANAFELQEDYNDYGWDKLIKICRYIYSIEQQLKKKDEVIEKLIKNENSNNFLKDSLKLQIEMNKLLKKHKVTMEDLRNLCIPFRDKYNFTDHQTLRIAREEVSKEELLQILEDKEVE